MNNFTLRSKSLPRILLIIFFGLLIFSSFTTVNSTFSKGDSIVWATGERKATTGYIKATYNSISNSSNLLIDFQEFDFYGDPKENITENVPMPNFWVTVENVTSYGENSYEKASTTILDEEIDCVIIERANGEIVTSYYYDLASGVMVYASGTDDSFIRLISWTDIDIKAYADETNKGIPGYGLFLLGSVSLITLAIKTKKISLK
ncbi:hypothetical protein NEF87_003564 [Candidatus Lokiarchaeum ossiferum]|uniref:Uncharacterized protein n=1 Tax=Candidatus Lokiarchaeum ossiferum TaxID=2951803 RepID=A0ABY6HXW3_9ARCH|nr:hypothetical protein NEF87_003564 [Candidatus Lokiarchaeum sp. B-35]